MQHRDRHREALAKARHELRRESDLRHQHQRALAACAAQCSTACRYTSVLPLPVMPYSRKGAKLLRRRHRWRRTAAACSALSAGPVRAQQRADPRRRSPRRHLAPRREAARHQRAHRRAPVARICPPACRSRCPARRAGSRAARAGGARDSSSSAVERRDARTAREPAFGERARRRRRRARASAARRRSLRRRSGGSTARRIRPAPDAGVDHRLVVDDLEQRLEFFARHFRARRPSECTTPMRRWRPKGTRTRAPGGG